MKQKAIRLLLSFFLVVACIGELQALANDKEKDKGKECCSHVDKEVIDIHVEMYYYLLAEKFAPEQVEVWQEIKNERDILKKKLAELNKSGALLNGGKVDYSWIEEHVDIQEQLKSAVKNFNEEELKQIIPKLFSHEKKLNDIYKKHIEMAK